jgi:hypothetical protein
LGHAIDHVASGLQSALKKTPDFPGGVAISYADPGGELVDVHSGTSDPHLQLLYCFFARHFPFGVTSDTIGHHVEAHLIVAEVGILIEGSSTSRIG